VRVWSIYDFFCSSDNFASISSTKDAKATLSFIGEAVAVYGTVSPDHANISITVDGKTHVLSGGSGGLISTVRPEVRDYSFSDLEFFVTDRFNRPLL